MRQNVSRIRARPVLGRGESQRLVNSDKRHRINGAQRRQVINALVSLSKVEEKFDVDAFITYFHDRGGFTPQQLFTLFWRFDKYAIAYSPLNFKLVIRRGREQEQLRRMDDWKLAILWPAMSTQQQAWVRKNTGHRP